MSYYQVTYDSLKFVPYDMGPVQHKHTDFKQTFLNFLNFYDGATGNVQGVEVVSCKKYTFTFSNREPLNSRTTKP